ncbi:MAG: transcription factor WhiB [Pseudonocardiales bacterium]|nr:transcription factor WhiB [Pseudonocardiales bacterium]
MTSLSFLRDLAWTLVSACRAADPELFFPADDERGPDKTNRENAAKAVCGSCPVQGHCLQWAMKADEPYGIWGGTTARDRDRLNGRPPRRAA